MRLCHSIFIGIELFSKKLLSGTQEANNIESGDKKKSKCRVWCLQLEK